MPPLDLQPQRQTNPAPGTMTRRRRLRRATGRMLPTLATLGNLVSGFAAIYYASKGIGGERAAFTTDTLTVTYFAVAGWLIFIAMVFDGLDGRLARMVRSTSDLGAQLDSLADVISFGLAPAFVMLQLLISRFAGLFQDQWFGTEDGTRLVGRAIWVIAAIFVCCAALRLARFNVETTEDESAHMWFKGLPSPGAAAALASLVILMEQWAGQQVATWQGQTLSLALPPVALAAALLMVSSLPYPHAFNHFIRGRHPFRNLVLALLLVGLLLIGWRFAIAAVSVGYALFGPIFAAYRRLFGGGRPVDEMAAEVVLDDDEEEEDEDAAER